MLPKIRQAIVQEKFALRHTDFIYGGLQLIADFKSLADALQTLLAIAHLNDSWLHLYKTYHQVWKNIRKIKPLAEKHRPALGY